LAPGRKMSLAMWKIWISSPFGEIKVVLFKSFEPFCSFELFCALEKGRDFAYAPDYGRDLTTT
jgi:hypothetical protein